MPRVGLLQITKLLTLAAHGYPRSAGDYSCFLFWVFTASTSRPPSRLGERMQLTSFPGLSRFFQTPLQAPSTTPVSYICFVGALALLCCLLAGAGSPSFKGKPGHSRAQVSNSCAHRRGENEPPLSPTARRNRNRHLRLFIPSLRYGGSDRAALST